MSRKRVHKQEITDEESPKRLYTHLSTKALESGSFFRLPQNVLSNILTKCNVSELAKLAMVSKGCRDLVLCWLEEDTRLSIFPSLLSNDMKQNSIKYQASVGNKLYRIEPNMARINFHELGLMVKLLTCLFPTDRRMEISGKLLSRITLYDKNFPNCEFMKCCGIFLHSFTKGWQFDECKLASVTLIKAFNSNGVFSAILDEHYKMGTDPLLEINTHSFLFSMFWQDVDNRKMWLLFLLHHAIPDPSLSPSIVAKILLLMLTLPRNHNSPIGLSWEDHSEAVPATAEVASSRYQHLVAGLVLLHGHIPLPQVLEQVFKTPEQWIPENVASVLLLCGPTITKEFLLYQVDVCPSCYGLVTDTIAGLLWMTVRFRDSFDNVLSYIDMLIGAVPHDSNRTLFFRALWTALANEARNLQDLVEEGEEWALEGVKVIYTSIRTLGERLTVKAYGRKSTENNMITESEE